MPWDGKFTDRSAKRGKKPSRHNKTAYSDQFIMSDADIPLAVHHITDWDLLRSVWNRMIDDGHWATICIWLYAVGFDTGNIYYETGQAQTPAAITRKIMTNDDIREVADEDEIHTRVTWSPWNLVEGPKEDTRSDDLGNFHDTFSNVAGLADQQRADMVMADQVYVIMAQMNTSAAVPAMQTRSLANALLGVNRGATLIRYNPQMWQKSPGGGKKCWSKKPR